MGRVVEVYPSEDGLVRSISVKTGKSTYKRPIHKVVLLMATEKEDEQENKAHRDGRINQRRQQNQR